MNRFTKTAAVAGATGIAASLLIASPAAAEEIACTGSLGAITVDNLRVPQGATCLLDGTQVEGTITVKGNARLVAVNVDVDGNVQAENSRRVVVKGGSTVGGSVQIVQSGAARVARTAVNADIQFDANSRPLAALRNTVGGNIQVIQNTGGVDISNNRVDGNLQCKENDPAPVGGGNIVQGSKEDQCADL